MVNAMIFHRKGAKTQREFMTVRNATELLEVI